MKKPSPVGAPQGFEQVPRALVDAEVRRRKKAKTASPIIAAAPPRESFREFMPDAWGQVEGRWRPYLPSRHIEMKAEVLQAVADGELDKVIICEPPSFGKSLVTSVLFPAWDWGPNHRPDRRYLCLSYGDDDKSPANRDAERCRELIASPWYQQKYCTAFRLSDVQNAKSYFKNDQGGYRMSTGLDGKVPGQRADIIIIDDPTKPPEDTDQPSFDEITHAERIWETQLRSRAWDDHAAVILVMHRLHVDDLAGYFLKDGGWTLVRLPAFYEAQFPCRIVSPKTGRLIAEDGRQDGEPLHPARTKATEETRARAVKFPSIHLAQDQQRPADAAGAVIKRLMRWTSATLPGVWDELIVTVDCAFKAEKDNSFVVFQKWGRRHVHAYLLDQVRDHMELPATCTALKSFCERLPIAPAKYVEAKANGIGVVQVLRNSVPGLITTDDDPEVLKPFCAGSKEAKVQAVAPYFAAGNVYIPENDAFSWVPDYVHELTHFPRVRNNDQADATAMAVWRLLYSFEAQVPAADVMTIENDNWSPLAGTFETAYGPANPAPHGATDIGSAAGVTIGGAGVLAGLERELFGGR